MPTGIEARKGKSGGRLRITFTWQGKRRRETLNIPVTAANIKYAVTLRASIQNAIERQTFDYATFFPESAQAKKIATPRVRESVFGYLIALAVLAFIVSILTGQGPNSHYGPY